MSFWDSIHGNLDNLNKAFAKFDANPYFSHAVDWLGDFLMGRHFFKKEITPEGKTVRTINHQWFRREASHVFAESHLDENVWREITYSRHFKAGNRVRLFDNWGPDPRVADPDPLLGQIGPNQWGDIRLTLVDNLFQDVECQHPITGDEREEIIIELCKTLTEIAQLDDVYKLRRFVRLEFCKQRESDYKVKRFEKISGFVSRNMQELIRNIARWLNDPGPTGFRQLATQAARGINQSRPYVRFGCQYAANYLNATADLIRPTGWIRLFIGN